MRSRRIDSAATRSFLMLASCGSVFAAKIMFSKAALDAGADPFQIGVLSNLVAGSLLYLWLVAQGDSISFERRCMTLYVALGIVSVGLPTVLSFFVVDRVGPAYTATVYSLSPLLTMGFAAGLGIERMTLRRSCGIGLGFAGMVVLVQQQSASIDLAQTTWVAVGLLIPASAALGNIIRSAFWPKGASALAFACATLLTSSLFMIILSPVLSSPGRWRFDDPTIAAWLASFALVSALSSVLNFRLQCVAGPVVFSQIGYWGTGFGVVFATVLFGDALTGLSLIGLAAIIVGGILARRQDR